MKQVQNDLSIIYAEIYELLKYMDIEHLMKIPSNVLREIRINKSENWHYKYNPEMCLEDQKILEETKDFFSILFYRYCCNEDEKKDIFQHWIKNTKKTNC